MNVPTTPPWSVKIEGWLRFTDQRKTVDNTPTVAVKKRVFFWSLDPNASADAETKEAKYLLSIDKFYSSGGGPTACG